MPPTSPEFLIVQNETVPNSDPGAEFASAGRMNYVNHIANDGGVPILVSFDDPHPVPNAIEIKASESLNDLDVAGGFRRIFIRGDGGTPTVRVLALYRTDLPDRTEETQDRTGTLEVLREIRDSLAASEPEEPPEVEQTAQEDQAVDVALGIDRAGGIPFLPLLLAAGIFLTFFFSGDMQEGRGI